MRIILPSLDWPHQIVPICISSASAYPQMHKSSGVTFNVEQMQLNTSGRDKGTEGKKRGTETEGT